MTQNQINRLIVESAYKHGHVVRLKGGDPLIFGRGYEEIRHAQLHGIETEVVPGISSATALTGLASVPLTHRGVSRSFWVVTATTKGNEISEDFILAAQSNATVVVLMGLKKLSKLIDEYEVNNKLDLPVMIIQNGSTNKENIITGSVNTIEELFDEHQVDGPGLIVFGEVVGLREELDQELLNRMINN